MRTRLFCFLLTVSLAVMCYGQGTTFYARVMDGDSGEPLPLVGVYIDEERNTLTNFDGEFSITAAPDEKIRLTCIGHKTLLMPASELSVTQGAMTEIRMPMIASTLSEVTVQAVESKLLQVCDKMDLAYDRRREKEAQYFYRQTSIFTDKQDIVEAFVRAHSAVNLRELQFLTGRHGLLSDDAGQRSNIQEMNLHHLLEIGPMTKSAQFWKNLIAPLRPEGIIDMAGNSFRGIRYLQLFYDITLDELDDEGQHLYCFNLQSRKDLKRPEPIMTGRLYVDRQSLLPLAFDGQVENLKLSFKKGNLSSSTVVPMTFDYHIDYRHDHKFPEVSDLLVQAQWGDFSMRTLLFNVEGQKHLQINRKKGKARENMLASIAEAGYDSLFWANHEVIKRTAQEQAIAQGRVDIVQARLDSAAAYQASLPPLERLADHLKHTGERIPQEKVFVHMDNTCYYLGDTIWFAAYTRQTNTDSPSKISRVLYAELWNHDGYMVERKLLEMKDGRGNGFFALPDTLYSGYFELRAYTRWQLNWGQTEHEHPWVKEDYNDTVNAEFYRDYEKLYSRVFPVYDKPKEQGTYYKDMTYRPLRRYFKDAPPPSELRLSLFPEGGNLVAGVPCRVAFEAATSEGEVREGTASLLMKNEEIRMKNEQGEEVTSVRTENRGRGTFTFTPMEGQSYEVVFQADVDSTKKGRVTEKIKAVTGDGVSLRLRHTGEEWTANIQSMGSAAEHPLGMTVMHEGRLQCFTALTPDARQVVLADSTLSAGINQLTIFDAEGRVYADRLFFVTKPELQHTTLMMDGLKEEYKPFEQVSLLVKAKPKILHSSFSTLHSEAKPRISLSVRDAVHQDNIFDSGNILTEMLLSSEIKGFVPQPEYFFEADDAEHRRALDLLMLTQGWRRFGWKEMAVEGAFELTHPAEYTQMVTGSVHPYRLERYVLEEDITAGLLDSAGINPDSPAAKYEKIKNARNDALDKGGYSEWRKGSEKTWEKNKAFDYEREEYDRRQENRIINAIEYATPLLPKGFDPEMRDFLRRDWRRFIAMDNLKREVRVHAEFVRGEDIIVGEQETKNKGSFNIDLPHFYGECHFFLDASDTTLWPRKKDGITLRKKHKWIREQDSENEKLPELPEFYVRLHWPYPRYVKPYTFYQTHHASLRDTTTLSPKLLTDGTHLMREVHILAPENGQLHLDFSKPAYVMDAYEATNMAMDAGQLDHFVSWEYMQDESKWIADAVAHTLVADMGTSRVPDFTLFYDTLKVFGHYPYKNYQYVNQEWIASGERLRWGRLEYLDKIYLYTDYSPRREGDARYEQDNQPSLDVRLVRFPANVSRMTYLNRYYVLKGFAYQEDFYHPDYHRNPPKEGQKDYRRTLYWNPDLQLDEEGRANITFFNNSQTTRLCVEANGQAPDGTLLYNGGPQAP